jgi:hypothetical protein
MDGLLNGRAVFSGKSYLKIVVLPISTMILMQVVFSEGAGAFMPLKRVSDVLAFRPGPSTEENERSEAKALLFQALIQGHKCPCSLLRFERWYRQ